MLKSNPLTRDEIEKFAYDGFNKNAITNQENDSFENVAYYSSDNCGSLINPDFPNSNNTLGCTSNYNKSEIKKIVDNWSKSVFEVFELSTDEYGYSVRLLKQNELFENLYYENQRRNDTGISEKIVPTRKEDDYDIVGCWIMNDENDSQKYTLIRNNEYFYNSAVYNKIGKICPVVTLLKKDFNSNNNSNNVSVPNTYVNIRHLYVLVGFAVIILLL